MSSGEQITRRPSVLLAEDHIETARQLRTLLESDFDVVGVVTDGRSLMKAVTILSPDAIVTDISMPELDGIDATVLIRRDDPRARIVLVTVHTNPMLVQRGLAAGALGYVLKDAAGDDLLVAVHAALRGEHYVSRALAGHEPMPRPE